jgi:hypothetical protein
MARNFRGGGRAAGTGNLPGQETETTEERIAELRTKAAALPVESTARQIIEHTLLHNYGVSS